MAGMEGNRAQRNDRQLKMSGERQRGEERGSLYEDIGISSEQFKESVGQLRLYLQEKRAEHGEGFNEAEYLRGDLYWHTYCDMELDREDAQLYKQMLLGWDVLAFNRYSEEVKNEAASGLKYVSNLPPDYFAASKSELLLAIAKLDVMATTIGLPSKELDAQQIVTEAEVPSAVHEWIKRHNLDREAGLFCSLNLQMPLRRRSRYSKHEH